MERTLSCTIATLNRRYTQKLNSNPLLTKALTLAFFALLNEQLASLFAGDIQELVVTRNVSLPHTITAKVPLMGVFAALVNAPITHYGYRLINRVIPAPLTTRKKVLQILLGTGVVTPIFCACFVSWVGIINSLQKLKDEYKRGGDWIAKLKNVIKHMILIVRTSLKTNFIKVTTTSVFANPVFMFLAQKFVAPEAWAVFFALCYFIVGTYNNTRVKLAQRKLKRRQKDDGYDRKSE